MQLDNKPNIAKAIIAVMKAVKGIDKTMTVGSGSMAYKGVADQEVKKVIGAAMEANGLCLLPIDIDAKAQMDRWVDDQGRQKQSVFTEVKTSYLLMHESGESVTIAGYGHGVDSQDKGAGKATTYALKYALLYAFMVPTGKIDDADATHSDTHDAPPQAKPWLNEGSNQFQDAIKYLRDGGGTLDRIEGKYRLSKATKDRLIEESLKAA